MRKHQFKKTSDYEFAGHTFPVFTCIHCDKTMMLNEHQLHDLPKGMAKCKSKNALRASIMVSWGLRGADCLEA